MSARRTGSTAVNKRGVRHPRQPSAVPPPSGVVTLASAQLTDAPLVRWLLDDASGTTAVDTSGNGRDGTYANCTLAQTAIASNGANSVSFGTVGTVSIANAAWMGVDDFTMEVLVYPTDLTAIRGLMTRDTGGGPRIYFSATAILNLTTYNNSATAYSTSTGAAKTANAAYLIALKWDSTAHTSTTFINGAQYSQVANSGTAAKPTAQIQLGRRQPDGSGQFLGKMSHAAYYGTALSDARLLAHAQAAGLA